MTDALEVVIPTTGEILNLADAEQAADAWLAIRQIEAQLAELKDLVKERLLEESQTVGSKTLHLGHATVEVRGGPQTTFDVEDLRGRLRTAGLPEARLEEVIKARVEYRVDQRETRSLAAANPAYAQAIKAAQVEEPRPWYVTVKGAT